MSPVGKSANGPRTPSRFFADWADEPDSDERPERSRRWLPRRTGVLVTLGALVAGTVLTASTAQADPSGSAWYRLRMCESSNNYKINTGNGYYGAYQFDLGTWRSVGGSGYPNQASPGEQDARALILYRERGWQPWTCARILGLREDSDARSGRISDIHVPTGGGTTGGVPTYPSTRSYSFGDTSPVIKAFQDQMNKRGAIPPGTGYYGPLTLTVVKRLQMLNGIRSSGLLGPLTWHAAFAGTWSRPSTGGTPPPPPSAPAYPSTRSYSFGEKSTVIAAFQRQMRTRGATQLTGTGQYGPLTLAVVKRLQTLNGLRSSGLLGPLTWHAAFVGKWSNA